MPYDASPSTASQLGQERRCHMFFDQYGNLLVSASANTPVAVADHVRAYSLLGQGFVYTSGQLQSPASNVNLGLSVFNPATSGKSILLYSIKIFYSGYAMFYLVPTSVDPALGSAAGVTNTLFSSAKTSSASASYTNTNLTPPATNTLLEGMQSAGNYTIADLLTNNAVYILPKGNATGLLLFFNSPAANTWIAAMKGIEF